MAFRSFRDGPRKEISFLLTSLQVLTARKPVVLVLSGKSLTLEAPRQSYGKPQTSGGKINTNRETSNVWHNSYSEESGGNDVFHGLDTPS
jgi:hypothetical protein